MIVRLAFQPRMGLSPKAPFRLTAPPPAPPKKKKKKENTQKKEKDKKKSKD